MYLREEGLDAVIAARQAAGDAEKAAKERYARYAKVAVRNGSGSGAHLTRPVDLKAEFVPTTALENVSSVAAYTTYGVHQSYTFRGFSDSVMMVDGLRKEGNRVNTQPRERRSARGPEGAGIGAVRRLCHRRRRESGSQEAVA